MDDDLTILLVDDDEAIRDSVGFLLESDGHQVRTFASPLDLLTNLESSRAGCVITDVRMPEMGGLEVVQRIRASGCDVPVIVITGHADVALAVEAMRSGAADFIEKPFEDEVLLQAVRRALRRRDADPRSSEADAEVARRFEALSRREREVMQGLIDGQANKVIARELDISPRTVEVYRANLMTKMGAASYAELIRMALLAGVDARRGQG